VARSGAISPAGWWRLAPPPETVHLPAGDVCHSDALLLLQALKPKSADIIFLDPPFNLGKSYAARGPSDNLDETSYHRYIESVLVTASAALKPGGTLYLYHIPKWAIRFAPVLDRHLTFRHWIAISMKNGFVRGPYLYPAHYALLCFTRDNPKMFRRPKIPAPKCRHCHGYIRDYGGYEKYVRDGINLSDFWDDISPVRHKKYKNRQANELPLEIPRRAVAISGRRGGLLVDPFAGSGTALVAALEANMRFVGGDVSKRYCQLMQKRLASPSPKGTPCHRTILP